MIHCDCLLQNTTDSITTCDSYFIAKYNKSLWQNTLGFLSQNVTISRKCDNYYKLWHCIVFGIVGSRNILTKLIWWKSFIVVKLKASLQFKIFRVLWITIYLSKYKYKTQKNSMIFQVITLLRKARFWKILAHFHSKFSS